MAGFGGEDATGCGEVVGGGDVGGSAKVGTDTDALEHGGEGDEGLRVRVREAVDAFGRRSLAEAGEDGREESDVRGLVGVDSLEVRVDVWTEASGCELGCGEVGNSLTVEGGL